MKKLIATLCIVGSAFALNACETSGSGNIDDAPPYSQSRTASHGSEVAPAPAPARAERVFREVQTK